MPGRIAARLLLVAAGVLFSTGGAAVKAVALTGAQVASLRSGVASLALLLLVPAARRAWSPGTLFVGAAYATTMILYVIANKHTTAASVIFLQAASPLYILPLGWWLLRERIGGRDLLLMAAVGAGLAILLSDVAEPVATASDPSLGNVLAVCVGFTWALTMIGLRRMASRGSEGLTAILAGNVLACLACAPFALPIEGASDVSVADWALIGYLGVFQIGLAYLCLARGLRAVPAFEASLLLMVEPVLNPLWAWLAHGEAVGAWTLFGGALILGATVVHTLRARAPG